MLHEHEDHDHDHEIIFMNNNYFHEKKFLLRKGPFFNIRGDV